MSETTYNLDALFGDMAAATEMSSELTFLKKGDEFVVALCGPAEYNGKMVLTVPVESEYNGKKNKQFIVRFVKIQRSGKEINWDASSVVGIPLPATVVNNIAKLFQSDYAFGEAECNLLMLTKNPKTEIVPSPKTVVIPDEVWEKQKDLTWETLVDSFNAAQNSKVEKEEAQEGVLW